MQIIISRIRNFAIDLMTYDEILSFAKEHYEKNHVVLIGGEFGRYIPVKKAEKRLTNLEEKLRGLRIEPSRSLTAGFNRPCPDCKDGIVSEWHVDNMYEWWTIYGCERCGYYSDEKKGRGGRPPRGGRPLWTTDN